MLAFTAEAISVPTTDKPEIQCPNCVHNQTTIQYQQKLTDQAITRKRAVQLDPSSKPNSSEQKKSMKGPRR